MRKCSYTKNEFKSIEHLLGYFDQQVLAGYRNEPQKYKLRSDFFEGHLEIADDYYLDSISKGNEPESVDIRFGYRTLNNGDLAIVAWLPDLYKKSNSHVSRWNGFHITEPHWSDKYDERFDKWVKRYIEGNWDVDNGPMYHLREIIAIVNGMTKELVGTGLFKFEISDTMSYPAAENTHRYQDCHKELYGYIIDGIDKECITELALLLGRDIKIGDRNTLQSLKMLFPSVEETKNFTLAMNTISEQRRFAAHGARAKAKQFEAFSQYTKDLELCVDAISELMSVIETTFDVDGKYLNKRYEDKKMLPVISQPAEGHYSINGVSFMVGKTVKKVEFGFRNDIENVHRSEALIIYFSDGSIMGLDTGTNASNLCDDNNDLKPEDFHVDFIVNWVRSLDKE